MDNETRSMVSSLEDESSKALIVGDEVIFPPWQVGGKSFHFDAFQVRFLVALQKHKGDLARAADIVGKPLDWAQKFISSRKFRAFRNAKIASASVRNGDLMEWWWQMGLEGARGFRQFYEAECAICHERNEYSDAEAAMAVTDDMKVALTCKVCLQPVQAELKREEVKHSREQVQFWSELGNRLAPKIERVQHEFSKETFVFTSPE